MTTQFSEAETRFLAKAEFHNFAGNMQFEILEEDTGRPDLMFCRLGLFLTETTAQIGVLLEGDYRLFRNYFNRTVGDCPAGTDNKVLLTLCHGLTIKQRIDILCQIPYMAKQHEKAFGKVLK